MKVFVFPQAEGYTTQKQLEEIQEIIKNADEKLDNLYIGNISELWVLDLDNQCMYIANSENPKLLKLEPIHTLSTTARKEEPP